MGEIAIELREGLLALAVGAGLQVMLQLMEADAAATCGPRGKHARTRRRLGTAPKQVGHRGWSAGLGDPAQDPRERWHR